MVGVILTLAAARPSGFLIWFDAAGENAKILSVRAQFVCWYDEPRFDNLRMEVAQMTIGEQLSAARRKRNLTQQQVADKLHVARQTISNWENGRSYPDIASLIALSDLFAISLDQLLKEDSIMVDELKAKEQERKQARWLYWISMSVGLALLMVIWMANANCLGFTMSDSVMYALFVIFYADMVVVFVTSRRYRQLAHKVMDWQLHRGTIAALLVAGALLGVAWYFLERSLFRGVVFVVGIALVIVGIVQQNQRHS